MRMLPTSIVPTDFFAVEIPRDEILLIQSALKYASDEAYVQMQMPFPEAGSVGLALSDWAADWSRNISEAAVRPLQDAFCDPARYAYRFFIVQDEQLERYILFGDIRITSRLQTILHFGQTWAQSKSCAASIGMKQAMNAGLLTAYEYDEAAVAGEQKAIFDRFSAMREAI